MIIEKLRVNHIENPVGYALDTISLSWIVTEAKGNYGKFAQIQISKEEEFQEVILDTGKATLYKWGAAPSWLLTEAGAEKVGTGGPPPGLWVEDSCRTSRVLLGPGKTLVLLSDGVAGADMLRRWEPAGESAGDLAARLLERQKGTDDATVALVTLHTA